MLDSLNVYRYQSLSRSVQTKIAELLGGRFVDHLGIGKADLPKLTFSAVRASWSVEVWIHQQA